VTPAFGVLEKWGGSEELQVSVMGVLSVVRKDPLAASSRTDTQKRRSTRLFMFKGGFNLTRGS